MNSKTMMLLTEEAPHTLILVMDTELVTIVRKYNKYCGNSPLH